MDQNQQVLAKAFRKTKGKRGAVIKHGISIELYKHDEDGKLIVPNELAPAGVKLITKLAKAKAIKEGGEYSTYLDGQQWYIEDLIDFSTMLVPDQLEAEYNFAFPDVASKDEMLAALEAVA